MVYFRIAVFITVMTIGTFAYCSDVAGVDYKIGPQDIIEIVVWENNDLTGKFSVSLDGYINYQFIGKIKAEGLTTSELAYKITEMLSAGYLINPQITARVLEYKSKNVFILGEASKPGTYYLTKESTTLVEAVSMAGGPTKDADSVVIVVRPKAGFALKGGDFITLAEGGEQTQVDLRKAFEGDLSQNIFVQNGDSIFIPKAKTFFIMGEVKNPGEYKLDKDTTVRKAISIAGGATDKASLSRIKMVTGKDGKTIEEDAKLDEPVSPNNTIVVPQSIF